MVILTENNAFQNVGKCLQKRCNDITQIEDFLQYCIELIFFDRTRIVGTVPPNVINDSKEIVGMLRDFYSIDNIEFENVKDNDKKAHDLIHSVAQVLYIQIDAFFENFKSLTKNAVLEYLPTLAKDSIELVVDTTRAINEKNLNKLSDEYLKLSTFSRDSCYFKIINDDPRIIKRIFEFNDRFTWNEAMSLNLLTEIRFLTNRSLAKMNKQVFLPSIKRSRMDAKNKLIPKSIDSIIKEYGNLIGQIEMPSLKDYIIEKGLGKPKEMMKIAFELRNNFRPIRDYIRDIGKSNVTNSISVLNEIKNSILNKINNGPPYDSKIVLENARTDTIGVGPFTVSVPVIDTKTIERIRKLSVCVEAFTEVLEDMLEYQNYGFSQELKINCMK